MPYQFDVFISYKRGRINDQWLTEIFLPFFESYLDDELPHRPKIFLDKTGLTPGVDFNNELFQNLICSKCLVAICSPPYFRRSEWCIKEFLTMKYMQEYYKLGVHTVPRTLIWPVIYREIQPLPDIIKNINFLDYSEFNVVGEAFFKSEKSLKFQEKLQEDISTISDIILNVPPLNPIMETAEGRKQLLKELNAYLEKNAEDADSVPKQNPISW